MKVVINARHGGFGLSEAAYTLLKKRMGDEAPMYGYGDPDMQEFRANPGVIAVIEEMGEEANGRHARLVVLEIPDDVDFVIEEYDGYEWIAERHRTWHHKEGDTK